jgi:hypothetical protein
MEADVAFEEWLSKKKEEQKSSPKEKHDDAFFEQQIEAHAKEMNERIAQIRIRHNERMGQSAKLQKARQREFHSGNAQKLKSHNWSKQAAIHQTRSGLAFMMESMQRSPFAQDIRKSRRGGGAKVSTQYGKEHPAHHQM